MIFFRRSHPFDPNWDMTPELRWRIWTSGWRGALVLLTLIAVPLAVWKGPDAYQGMKVWRASHLIDLAETAQQTGDFKEAANLLRQATLLLQKHPLTLRAVARYQIAIQDAGVLKTYQALIETGMATTDDQFAFARHAFRLGQTAIADSVLSDLEPLPEINNTTMMRVLKAEQSSARGHWTQALELARQAIASPGSSEDKSYAQSLLARLLLHAPAPTAEAGLVMRAEGISLLSSLALHADDVGLAALEMLVSLAQNPQVAVHFQHRKVQDVLDAAEHHPRAGAALKVSAWNLRLAAAPTQRADITQAFLARFKDEPSTATRLEATRWLNQRGLHEQALAMAEPSKLESRDWFLVYLDAKASLGRWQEVLSALNPESQDIPLAPAVRKLFELRGSQATGRRIDTAAVWREIHVALRHAESSDRLYAAGYAEKMGFPAEAAKIYHQSLERDNEVQPTEDKLGRPRRLACYLGLLRTGGGTLSLNDLGKVMDDLADEFPELDEVQNDRAYLQLLAGKNLDQATSTAQKLSAQKPGLLAYRTTVALALLRQEKLAAAEVYDGWTIDWSTAQDRYKAVYVAVMRSAGRGEEALPVAATINAAALRVEERQLVGLP